ncbi:unnamed protein product [Polarella glacialis]|uniref:Protein kinase domain-containing protein n=1 Tax=Polarella glacialis TaxID=89957 RepID=A0A813KRM1_POLGL|nr:unnamed protein product [Polarella glacialis]
MKSPEGDDQAVSFSVGTDASHLAQKSRCFKVRALDIRFEPRLESAFKEHLQPLIRKRTGYACLALGLLGVVGVASSFNAETTRQDLPFTWGKLDARTMYFGTQFFGIGAAFLIAVLSVMPSCCWWLRWLDWELIMTGYGVLFMVCSYMMNYKYVAGLYEDGLKTAPLAFEPGCSCGTQRLLFGLAAAISGATASLRVRCCLLWMLPGSALIAHVGFTFAVGGSNGDDFFLEWPQFLVFCCFNMYGAWQNEGHVRDKWLAQRRIQEQAADFADQAAVRSSIELLTGTLSDIVLEINADMTIMTTGSVMHDSFFGASVGGKNFTELACPEDRDRLLELLQRASRSHVLESCPMRLVRHRRDFEAQVMAVAVLCKVPLFVVGIREEHNSSKESALDDDFTHSLEDDNGGKRQAEGLADGMPQEVHNNQASDLRSQGALSLVESLATTRTERIFSDLAKVSAWDCGVDPLVQKRLRQVCELGCTEHWLLSWEELEVPDPAEARVLGKGGFGVVLLAGFHGCQVALKLPTTADGVAPARSLPSFANELRMLRRLRHPNIVLFYGAVIQPDLGVVALVSEFVDGTTLQSAATAIWPTPMALPERWWILLDISKALRFMHGQMPEILHGDLKGCNIMVESRPVRAKLLDFGLARLHKKGMQPLGGTTRWRAPELFWSRGRAATPAADVFSFGRVAFLTLTGLIPPAPPMKKHANDPDSLLDGAETLEELWAFTWPATAVSSMKQLCESCCRLNALKRWTMVQVQEEVHREVGTSRSTGTAMGHVPGEPSVEAESPGDRSTTTPTATATDLVPEFDPRSGVVTAGGAAMVEQLLVLKL